MSDLPGNNAITTREDADALVVGLTALGTGGGGLAERGMALLERLLEEEAPIGWTAQAALPGTCLTCSVFGMGTIATQDPLTDEERRELGFGDERFVHPGVRAANELSMHLGHEIEAIVPFEMGGYNTIVALDTALRLGVPLIDGDYCGRAVPELAQVLPAVLDRPVWPLAICDNWGNALVLKDAASPHIAERIGKMISVVSKTPRSTATCAHAAFPMSLSEARGAIVSGTMTRALELGWLMKVAHEKGHDVASLVGEALGGRKLFQGRVQEQRSSNEGGYLEGETELAGMADDDGRSAKIWFRNENHLIWIDGEIRATSPDLIMLIDLETGRALTNAESAIGRQVAVVGSRADPRYRSGRALAATEPLHYGFDLPYRPIEAIAS